MAPAVLTLQGTLAKPQVRPMNPATLRTGRRRGRERRADLTPVLELQAQEEGVRWWEAIRGQHRAQGAHWVGVTVYPRPRESSPDPRIEAQLTHVEFLHWQEMHSLKSGCKINSNPRLLPSGSLLSHELNRFEVNYQGVSPIQALLTPGEGLTLASVRTFSCTCPHCTCLPSRWTQPEEWTSNSLLLLAAIQANLVYSLWTLEFGAGGMEQGDLSLLLAFVTIAHPIQVLFLNNTRRIFSF